MSVILCLLNRAVEGATGATKWVHDTVHCALHRLYGTHIYSYTHLQPAWCAKQVVCFTACVSLFVCLLCRGDGGVSKWVHDSVHCALHQLYAIFTLTFNLWVQTFFKMASQQILTVCDGRVFAEPIGWPLHYNWPSVLSHWDSPWCYCEECQNW